MRATAMVVMALAATLAGPAIATADVDINIGIQVGAPPPPPRLVVTAPPPVVVVPNTSVYYVPSVDFNLFVFSGRYYSFHNGAWFRASNYNGPWVVVDAVHVPAPVRAVPVQYYKIPPGHAKKMGGWSPPGHGKDAHDKGKGHGKGKKHRDD
ncbi:MAG TPA: hypothetical protein VNL18_09180 [Gemmatimonadales bacterium]|nr:hypothetical protein [Gemmatimonadales bacterium]